MAKIFADGIIFKKPREGAPDFVKGSLSFKVEEAVAFLQKHNNKGWVNVDLLKSKTGTLYLALNEWKKEDSQKSIEDLPEVKAARAESSADIPW